MSTSKYFNSSIVKNKIPLGEYIGLKAEKFKRHMTDRGSNLIPKTINRMEKKLSDRNRYESISGKQSVHLELEESKTSF